MKWKWIIVAALIGLPIATASALPISYISATAVPTSFTPSGGEYGLGVLEISGNTPVFVHYEDGSRGVVDPANFLISTDLKSDDSAGGRARGLFEGGDLAIKDGLGT
ncbi:MAG: hypothetical protein HQ592_05560, partial [Planctomycetes bacterium]|nr:hypothetical protein [Planctomycetota bacterium]